MGSSFFSTSHVHNIDLKKDESSVEAQDTTLLENCIVELEPEAAGGGKRHGLLLLGVGEGALGLRRLLGDPRLDRPRKVAPEALGGAGGARVGTRERGEAGPANLRHGQGVRHLDAQPRAVRRAGDRLLPWPANARGLPEGRLAQHLHGHADHARGRSRVRAREGVGVRLLGGARDPGGAREDSGRQWGRKRRRRWQ